MMKLTIGNQRGGTGKTTTAVTLARVFAEMGKRTLLIDADPQGSVAYMLRLKPELFLNDFMWHKRRLEDCLVSPIENLKVLCSNRDTVEAESRAESQIGRERLFELLFAPYDGNFDVVLVDVSPSISLMQVCAMVYTQRFLIPISMDALSVVGASALLNTADLIRKQSKAACWPVALLPTVVDRRYRLTDEIMAMIARMGEADGIPVLPGIRTDATVSKATRQRCFIADLDPESKALEDYRAVANRLLELCEMPHGQEAQAAS